MAFAVRHPGEVLRREALPRFNGSVHALAGKLNVSVGVATELLEERISVNPALADRIAGLIGGQRSDYFRPVEHGDTLL